MMTFKKFIPIWRKRRQYSKKAKSVAKITKRQRFVITSLVLAFGLLSIQLMEAGWRYPAVAFLTILAYFLSAWALSEGLNGIEWLTVLALPTLFTAGIGLFYFLMPSSWLARVPVVLIYGLGFYGLLLTENIFSVAAIRTIQLLRSAQAVGFLLTLAASFFLYDTILAFRLDFWLNFLLIGVISFPLVLQALWYIRLEDQISRRLWFYSAAGALVLAQTVLAFSFWPVNVIIGSLALITVMYLLLGLFQHHLNERLFKKTIKEHLFTGAATLLIIFLTTRWGG